VSIGDLIGRFWFARPELVCPAFRGVRELESCCCPMTGGSIGKRGYPAEFRPKGARSARRRPAPTDLARDLGIGSQTMCNWRRQEQIDRGELPGLTSVEQVEVIKAPAAALTAESRRPNINEPLYKGPLLWH
jgi:transposase-like protein